MIYFSNQLNNQVQLVICSILFQTYAQEMQEIFVSTAEKKHRHTL